METSGQKTWTQNLGKTKYFPKLAKANRYMGLQKKKYEQISVGHFCGKHAMATATGLQKNKMNKFP